MGYVPRLKLVNTKIDNHISLLVASVSHDLLFPKASKHSSQVLHHGMAEVTGRYVFRDRLGNTICFSDSSHIAISRADKGHNVFDQFKQKHLHPQYNFKLG